MLIIKNAAKQTKGNQGYFAEGGRIRPIRN